MKEKRKQNQLSQLHEVIDNSCNIHATVGVRAALARVYSKEALSNPLLLPPSAPHALWDISGEAVPQCEM